MKKRRFVELGKEFQKNDYIYIILERSNKHYFAKLYKNPDYPLWETGRIKKEQMINNSLFGLHKADMCVLNNLKEKCYQHFLSYVGQDGGLIPM